MRMNLIASLLFQYFYSDHLVTHVTGWQMSDVKKDAKMPLPIFDDPFSESHEVGFYDEFECDAVRFMYFALYEISTSSLKKKLSVAKDGGGFAIKRVILDTDDYIFWARKALWSPTEMAMLSVGLRPSEHLLELFSRVTDKHSKHCKILAEYQERVELYYSAIRSASIGSDGQVLEIADWLERLEFPVPDGLFATVRRFHGPRTQIAIIEGNGKLDPREKNSLLQMILVMAMDCYKFDPKSKRVDMAKEIEERAASNGMKISRETIRTHLKSAGELLQGDWRHD